MGTLKIDYLSDPHVNHYTWRYTDKKRREKHTREFTKQLLKNKKGDVLVIAGDVSEHNDQTYWLLAEASKIYERVYFVLGNHDYYVVSKGQNGKYEDSLERIANLLDQLTTISNLVVLNKTIDTYKGATFAGDTMWYLPQNNDWNFFNMQSNDSRLVTHKDITKPQDLIMKLHNESLEWYKTLDNKHIDVFVSHVPPVHIPCSRFPNKNSCFMVDVPFLVSKHWITGHTHQIKEINIHDTDFYLNAIGYPFEGINQPNKIGIKTFEIKRGD